MKFLATGIIAAVFALESNAATVSNLRSLQVENCRFHNEAGDCTECIYRYVLDDGACRAVSNQCNTWNQSSGACTSCYPGWTLSNGECVVGGGSEQPTEPPTEVPTEPPTEQPNQPSCYFRQVRINGNCVNVSDQCNTWNETTGACTSCYGGYTLTSGGQCTA